MGDYVLLSMLSVLFNPDIDILYEFLLLLSSKFITYILLAGPLNSLNFTSLSAVMDF